MPGFVLKDTLIRGINSCASDVHLSVGDVPMLRIDGNLVRIPDAQPLTAEEMREAVRELLTESQIERFDDEREYDFSFSLDMGVKEQRFRANFSHEKGNPALALRAITANIRTMKQLGLPDDLKVMTQKNNGLFLVTGPTGSGKSTTLAAIIQEINLTRSVHIVTIEDPIEYLYTSEVALIHQRELGRDTKTFAEALRRAMRQDPDVIMVGETRDAETASISVRAAITGNCATLRRYPPRSPPLRRDISCSRRFTHATRPRVSTE